MGRQKDYICNELEGASPWKVSGLGLFLVCLGLFDGHQSKQCKRLKEKTSATMGLTILQGQQLASIDVSLGE